MKDQVTVRSERLDAPTYIEFLSRTDLGSQYPQERFAERIGRLVRHADISLTARDGAGKLIGVCFGLTDFAYWLFISDLGVDRAWIHRGVGARLLQAAMTEAGGEHDIVMYTCANEDAVGFYEKQGMTRSTDVMEYNRVDWTPFTVK